MSWRIFFLLVLIFIAPIRLCAMPVAFKGALGVMSYNQPDFQDWQINYSVTNRIAFGIDAVRDAMGFEQQYLTPTLNLLLQRWNAEDFQANIYAYGGYGVAKREPLIRGAFLVGGDVDFESRHVYFAAKASTLIATDFENSTEYQLRAGLSPYLADFESLQCWLFVQAQYYPRALAESLRIGPIFRLFYRNVLWELGVSARGTWSFNFMIHF